MDPWIIFFMVTVMLVNFRDNILEVENDRTELLFPSKPPSQPNRNRRHS